jgi:hypothetical protein
MTMSEAEIRKIVEQTIEHMIGNGLLAFPKIYDKKGVQDIFSFKSRTVDYLISTRQIPFIEITPRIFRFEADALKKWIQEKGNKNTPIAHDG